MKMVTEIEIPRNNFLRQEIKKGWISWNINDFVVEA